MKEWEAKVQHSLVLFSHAWWWGTLQIALREVIITEVSLHFSAVLLDWTDLKENLMKQLSVKWLYSVVDVLSTVFIPLTAFLFPVSPLIYQCNYRAAMKFCWNSLFSPLSTAFSFSNCYFFYIPWLPINSSKRKSLFESQSLSQVLLRIWFILGALVRRESLYPDYTDWSLEFSGTLTGPPIRNNDSYAWNPCKQSTGKVKLIWILYRLKLFTLI